LELKHGSLWTILLALEKCGSNLKGVTMTLDNKMVYMAENAAIVSFETKKMSMYEKAREFDRIPPEIHSQDVVFSVGNPFAEKWRKMLN